MTLKKKIIISFTIIVSVLLLTSAVLYITFRIAKISYDGIDKGEVTSDVIITRSENGTPYITASTPEDLFYALGYVHAQDKINIMEYERALANGTFNQFMKSPDSEILDRLSSIIGFTKEAETLSDKLNKEMMAYISSYVNGVNHIRHTRHLTVIGKNDWTPADVLSILIMKEWANAYLSNTELIFNFKEANKTQLAKIFSPSEIFYFYKDEDTQYIYILQRLKSLIEQYVGEFNQGFAAYINPSMNSTDNSSLSAFSYTGNYKTYPGWYPVNFKLKESTVSAITYSGLPFFFMFKKSDTLFCHFNINADSQDFTLFPTRNINNYQYNFRGIWRDFKPVRIPDGSNKSLHTLRWVTEKGPILSDLLGSEKQSDRILCINSVLPGPDYLKIITYGPFENNNIKLKSLILSSDGSLKGYILRKGKETYRIYSGFTTSNSLARNVLQDGTVYSRPDFLKISTSKTITSTDFIGSDITTPAEIPALRTGILISNNLKYYRIKELLPSKKIYKEESVQELTSDTRSGAAELFIPLFRQILDFNPLTSAKMTKLYYSEWDFTSRYKLQAPSIFYTTLNFLIDETFRDEFGDDTDIFIKYSYLFYDKFYHIFNRNLSTVFDNIKTNQIETREMIFDKAFLSSMRYLNRRKGPLMENWKWGEFNRSFYKIPDIKNSFFSYFFEINEFQSNGAPDTLYYSTFSLDPDFNSIASTALTGSMTDKSFRFRMNYGYSSSIFSDFYYGRTSKVHSSEPSKDNPSYKKVIHPY